MAPALLPGPISEFLKCFGDIGWSDGTHTCSTRVPFNLCFIHQDPLISYNSMSSFQFSCRNDIDWSPRNCIHMEYNSSLLSYPNLPFDQSITHNDKGSHDVRICTEWRFDKGCFYRKNQPRVPSWCQVSATPHALASTASLQGRNQGKGKGQTLSSFHGETG